MSCSCGWKRQCRSTESPTLLLAEHKKGVRDDDPMHVAPRGDGVTQRTARLDATDDREEEQVVVERTALPPPLCEVREGE